MFCLICPLSLVWRCFTLPHPQVFCLICPLITGVALLYFAAALAVWKYQLLYVYRQDYQSGGKVGLRRRRSAWCFWEALQEQRRSTLRALRCMQCVPGHPGYTCTWHLPCAL